jgi:alkylated DNA repair dioxygenase AlkB
MHQVELFEDAFRLPPGFQYRPDVISPDEEGRLVEWLQGLTFKPFEFHGFTGNRRIVSFGWRYEFKGVGGLRQADDIPDVLLPVREQAAAFAGLDACDLQHVLLTEYRPGAAIGWHRDRPEFGDVVGISLLSACTFRLRRKAGGGWERASIVLEPRSAYLLRGPSRTQWQHSIPAVAELRYSITFRSLRENANQTQRCSSRNEMKTSR